MIILALGLYIFINAFTIFVIVDIVLSWVGPNASFRKNVISPMVEPIYNLVRKIIPTRIGPIDLSALLVLIILNLSSKGLIAFIPELQQILTKI